MPEYFRGEGPVIGTGRKGWKISMIPFGERGPLDFNWRGRRAVHFRKKLTSLFSWAARDKENYEILYILYSSVFRGESLNQKFLQLALPDRPPVLGNAFLIP